MQAQLPALDLCPDTSLHLLNAKEAWLATPLQCLDCLAQRLVRVKVENRNPLRPRAVLRSLPLFDGEETMWHRSEFLLPGFHLVTREHTPNLGIRRRLA